MVLVHACKLGDGGPMSPFRKRPRSGIILVDCMFLRVFSPFEYRWLQEQLKCAASLLLCEAEDKAWGDKELTDNKHSSSCSGQPKPADGAVAVGAKIVSSDVADAKGVLRALVVRPHWAERVLQGHKT